VLRKDAIGVMAAVLLLLLPGCSSIGDAADGPDLVVAASLELTGSAADLGVAHERALRLKVDQINASGVLRDRKLRLVVADNQTDPSVAVSQVTRYAADSSVAAIIIGSCTECAVSAATVVNERGVPMISLAPATQVTTPLESRRFVFKLGPNVLDNARTLVLELVRAGVRTIGLITPEDAYGVDGKGAMEREALKAGIRITDSGKFQPTDGDLSGAARIAVAQKPDAVVVWAFPVQAGLAAAALREAGHRGRLYFDSSAAGNLFLAGPSAAAEGASLVFTQTLAMDDVIATTPAKAARKQWFEDYTSRYGSYHGHASFSADALDLVVAATNRVGRSDRAAVRGVLESIETDGLSGPIRITPNNHSGLMPQALTVLVARDGRWRLLG
jgi:branched-chain amino acid transport system substrate-binding protein